MLDYKNIAKRIKKIADEKDPQKLAYYIYFVIKQCPDGFFMTDFYTNLHNTIILVEDVYLWDTPLIKRFEEKFKELTKYIRK